MKFIATTSDKIDAIPFASGQLIFSRDDMVIYLDSDTRTSFQQIITIVDEEARLSIQTPLWGFYFVKETKVLWSWQQQWIQITDSPNEQIIYGLPDIGEEKVIYVDGTKLYQWDSFTNDYVEMCTPSWENIS